MVLGVEGRNAYYLIMWQAIQRDASSTRVRHKFRRHIASSMTRGHRFSILRLLMVGCQHQISLRYSSRTLLFGIPSDEIRSDSNKSSSSEPCSRKPQSISCRDRRSGGRWAADTRPYKPPTKLRRQMSFSYLANPQYQERSIDFIVIAAQPLINYVKQ